VEAFADAAGIARLGIVTPDPITGEYVLFIPSSYVSIPADNEPRAATVWLRLTVLVDGENDTVASALTPVDLGDGTLPKRQDLDGVHAVTFLEIEGGTVTAKPKAAFVNASITLTLNPKPGYSLEANSLKYSVGDAFIPGSATLLSDLHFIMPNNTVTIAAAFEEIPNPAALVNNIAYATLKAAFDAAIAAAIDAGGTATNPALITLLRDVDIDDSDQCITIPTGAFIRLVSGAAAGSAAGSAGATVKLTGNGAGNNGVGSLFTVAAGAGLTLGDGINPITLDGGAEWVSIAFGTTVPVPAPGSGRINNAPLVRVRGTLTIKAKAVVQNNKNANAADPGGGLGVEGSLILEGTVQRNYSIAYGGGVYAAPLDAANAPAPTVIVQGAGTVTGNAAGEKGGGLAIFEGVLTLKDTAAVTANTVSGSATGNGGGGVYFSATESGTRMIMEGTSSIGGADAQKNIALTGSGVYLNAVSGLTIQGGARVDRANDVYLDINNPIIVGSALTADPVAALTPSSYTGDSLLLADPAGANDPNPGPLAAGPLVAANHARFEVTPRAGYNWKITDQGKLVDVEFMRTSGLGTEYFSALTAALAALPQSNELFPITITMYKDTNFAAAADQMDIPANAYVRLVSGKSEGVIIKRTGLAGGSTPVFTVAANASFVLGDGAYPLTIDGGAVWADGVVGDPDTSAGHIAAESALVQVTGTLIMNGNTTLRNNSNTGDGGAVIVDSAGTFTMNGGTIDRNKARSGGGVYKDGAGTFTLSGGTISGNEGDIGGGVYINDGTFNMRGGTVGGTGTAKNTANTGGGGVYLRAGTFNMSGSATISGNEAIDGGGGVYSLGDFTMEDGTISGNTASVGGGVYSLGDFTMNNGTISGNEATGGLGVGGGVAVTSSGTFAMAGGTISTNTAHGGGGVFNEGVLNITSDTARITGNTGLWKGGGVYNAGAFTDLNTSVVTNNEEDDIYTP
jgi:hypothetical protein